MGYSGAGGKLNQKQKISWHCPFKHTPPAPSAYVPTGAYTDRERMKWKTDSIESWVQYAPVGINAEVAGGI